MAINGSEILNDPANTIISPFTNLLGSGFFLIPVSFIGLALYIKTRNITVIGAYFAASGVILGSANMFTSFPEMSLVYWVVCILGFVAVVLGVFFGFRK